MHQVSTLSVILVGANVLSLANAQIYPAPSDTESVLTVTAPGTTVVVTKTATATSSPVSRTSREPEPFPEDSEEDFAEAKRIAAACYPGYFESKIDWTAPCPAVQIIQADCTWGPDLREKLQDFFALQASEAEDPQAGMVSENWQQQPLELQRACFCSSQYADMVLGCGACLAAHGLEQAEMASYLATSNATAVQEFETMYCNATVEPTGDDSVAAFDVLFGQDEATTASRSVSSTASDTLGNATAVSLYFTPSVSSGYTIAMATASSSADQSHPNAWYTYTSLSTSDGLIVPTAIAEETTGANGNSGSQSGDGAAATGSTTTTAAGAAQTAMAGFGTGALAVAALALIL